MDTGFLFRPGGVAGRFGWNLKVLGSMVFTIDLMIKMDEGENHHKRRVSEITWTILLRITWSILHIDQHNTNWNSTYNLGLNKFADLTNEEYRARYLGVRNKDARRGLKDTMQGVDSRIRCSA
ncbi:hypothetical protein AMTR_s00144p00060090 [Amborella trichopoda]|uniref:Cathepsin propeptide inhibitor domain-containing protein n=1 Tax=Amborella trichopoda TaxID=13333 RepID=W1P7V9_AMBTC|nr:hypothetical protein AMTR_s00144p00060090 [Amborella trichopoda]